jgi:hypothetical protein
LVRIDALAVLRGDISLEGIRLSTPNSLRTVGWR